MSGGAGRVAARRLVPALPFALGMAAAVTACDRIAPASGGRLDATWTRADTGALAAPASAEWCAAGRYVRIEATRGDTGLAVAIFPADTKRTSLPGRYRLQDTLSDSSRPAAAVALRWSDPTSVSGFRGDSGTVVLRRGPDGRLAGEVKATGQLLGGLPRRLAIAGTFQDVAVTPASPDCPTLLAPPRADTGVHFPNDSIFGRLRRRLDLLPQRLRPQGGGGRPPQRGLPQRGGGSAPRQ